MRSLLALIVLVGCGGGEVTPSRDEPLTTTSPTTPTGAPVTDTVTLPTTTPTTDSAVTTVPTDTSATDTAAPFRVWSPDMIAHATAPCMQQLPEAFWCSAPSPEVVWEGVPAGTVSLALLMDDLDFAPGGDPFDHWAVYGIDPAETGIARGASGTGATGSLPAGAGEVDPYLGSCSDGENYYRWRLIALDAALPSAPASLATIESFAALHTVAVAEMCHCPEQECTF